MELKEKPKPGKGKDKTSNASRADKSQKAVSPAIPQKQASRMMKEKYIRELKDRPKGKEQEAGQTDGQAAEQVQDSGRWAAGELASTSKRMIRQGREYAKEKAETAKRDSPVPPADDPAEPQPYPSPEGTLLKDSEQEPHVYQSTTSKAASPMDEGIPEQAPPAASPKGPKAKKQPTVKKAPKERRLIEQEPVPPLDGKRQQSRDTAKPLKERPSGFKIKERPLAAASKGPSQSSGAVPVPRSSAARTGESTSSRKYGKGPPAQKAMEIRGEPEKTVSPGQSGMKPKMAVPLDQRRALVEKQKSSPYAPRDNIPFAPPDTQSHVGFPPPAPPSMPMPHSRPGPQQAPGASSVKNALVDKTRKAFKERQRIPQKNAEAAEKSAPFLKMRRTDGKPAVTPSQRERPAAAQRAAGAVRRQAQRKMLERPKKAVRSSVEALRRIAQVTAKTVSSVTSAVSILIGGGILLTALVVVIVIAAVANSPFGLFYAQEPYAPGTVSVSQAVGSVKEAYNAKLEELQTGDYDSIDVQGQAPDWTEVLAVFAVKLAGADIGGLDVATLDPDRVSKLTAVFWDMTAITTEVETIDHPASGNREAWTEKILHITITPKTADDMRTAYNFTPYQNSALDELLGDRPTLSGLAGSLDITGSDERGVLAALPADLEQARRDTVEKALSLVGKVNYFWGGKSHSIGWDSRWGTLQKVTAAGSPSTGTYRPFGLDCSGMIDWALRNAGLPSDGNWYIGVNLTRVSTGEARPGDMALFPDASHIGLVVGRNDAGKLLVCHCSSGRNNVVVTEFSATGFTVIGRPSIFG